MPITVGLLLFPNLTQLDLTGPYEVFRKTPDVTTLLLAKTPELVRAETGLGLMPDTTLADCPQLDVICVPGGPGVSALMEDEEVLGFLRRQAEGARYVTSVCTGALVLGAAGLLKGKRATTYWSVHDLLARLGAIPTKGRVVRDGRIFTGGGVTAGIDFALTLVAEMCGDEVAQGVQLAIEYAPAPPFDAGTPDGAPPEVVETIRRRLATSRAARESLLERVSARLAAD